MGIIIAAVIVQVADVEAMPESNGSPGDLPPEESTNAAGTSWWTSGYLGDYGAVLAGAVMFFGFKDATPGRARIGPVFDPDRPEKIMSPRHAGLLGKPRGQTLVPSKHVVLTTYLGVLWPAIPEVISIARLELKPRASANASELTRRVRLLRR